MKIHFYAHASFRLEGDGLAVITDPYTPGPEGSKYEPINEPADIVLMSSATDRFHSNPNHITGDPIIVNTLETPPEGQTVKGLHVLAYPTSESLTYDYGRDPDANAIYLFTLGEIRILHLGDVGNALPEKYLTALQGNVDILLALTGDRPTISLPDLDDAIQAIEPRVVIPMHYFNERGVLKILPVTAFTERYESEQVTWVDGSDIEFTPETLPSKMQIFVLKESR
jgi:L-ascorbate metabolism protein UlaG (beta-lactamase superfamily)